MKTLPIILLIIGALTISASWSVQPTNHPPGERWGTDRTEALRTDAINKYLTLEGTLSRSGQSNTVSQVSGVVTAIESQHTAAGIAMDVAMLRGLRLGQTNEVIQNLEQRLDGEIRELNSIAPPGSRDPECDSILRTALAYRSQYSHEYASPEIEREVVRALDAVRK